MSLVYHERPGVYSSYDASSIIARGSTERVIALIGKAEAKAGLYRLHSYAEAKEAFAEGSELGRMAKLAYQNGAGTVLASPVAEDTLEAYQAALALVFAEKEAGFCVVGSALETVQKALRDAVESASKQNGECVGIVGLAEPTLKNLTDRAAALNSERMVLVAPDVYVWGESTLAGGQMAAAALAGVLTDQSDPALPLNGQVLYGMTGVSKMYEDTEIDALVKGGVTVLECYGGRVSGMRGITTRTKTGQTEDATFRELGTILVIDDVIPAIRKSLRTKFARAKNNVLTRNAIRSQVIVELEKKKKAEIIDEYGDVTVTASEDDPTVCLVEFSFAVAHGLNQIYLTVHITV